MNVILNNTQTTSKIFLYLCISSIKRNYFMLFVGWRLIHTSNTKWFFIIYAIKSEHIVMIYASLRSFWIKQWSLKLTWNLNLLTIVVNQLLNFRNLKSFEGLSLCQTCRWFFSRRLWFWPCFCFNFHSNYLINNKV